MDRTIADAGDSGRAAGGSATGGPRTVGLGLGRAVRALAVAAVLSLGAAAAQTVNPVYMDDSTRARDALRAMPGLIASGNIPEAVRTLQNLLESEGMRVIEAEGDPDLFVDVRARINGFILARPVLLEAYREAQEAEARRLVAAGRVEDAERARWLTRAGLEAALRLAQRDIEAGRFEAARIGLEAAESHPDVGDAALARAGAVLSRLLAGYLTRDEVAGMARRYESRAGMGHIAAEVRLWPEAARRETLNPTTIQPSLDLRALDRRAQQAVRLAPESARPETPVPAPGGRERPDLPWVMPSVVGDLVLVNDGEYLSAWDRFTLAMRWRIRPPPRESGSDLRAFAPGINYRQALGQGLEDASFITPAGPLALATTGLARNGQREGDGRLHAVEIQTGRLAWSAEVERFDPMLAQGSIRGPALVDGDTAVVFVRTFVQFRRLQSVAAVGLDLHTGAPRWVRSLASAGTLPYRRPTAVADLGIVHHGVVYRVDELGTITALEAATGRAVWIRRMLSVSGPPESGEPWAMSAPMVVGDDLVLLSPDHREVLRLDVRTGALKGRRGADVLGWPRYILRVGDALAGVGVQRVAIVPLDTFETSPVRLSPVLPPPVIGRAVVAGGVLLVPMSSGLVVIDPANPTRPFDEATQVPLGRRGMVVAAQSQLIVADNDRLRSFLVWSEALERLRQQVEARPDDPLPALTLARLAARAGEWRLLAPSVDRCLDVLDAAGPGHDSFREDLFAFTLEIARRARLGSPEPDAPGVPPDVGAAMLDRLSRAARTPVQQLAHLMERGAALERTLQHGAACDAYQRILTEPHLAAAMWSQGVRSVRGGIEATDRLERLVARHGSAVYGAYERSATMERDALGASPAPEVIRALAERYPVATITPLLWLEIARSHEARGRALDAVAAIARAERAAAAIARSGVVPPGGSLPESIGSLVAARARLGEPAWALAALDRALAEFPAMAPTVEGEPVDVAALRLALEAMSDRLPRLARIGPAIQGDAARLPGRRVLRPVLGEGPHDAAVMTDADGRLEFWAVGDDGLVLAWEKDLAEGSIPAVLGVDDDRVLLFIAGDLRDGPTVECLARADGRLLWRTPGFSTLFSPDPDLQARFIAGQVRGATISTPLDGLVRLDDLIAARDGRTIAIAERSGRTAAFDAESGRPLWSRQLGLSQVHDVAVFGPRIIVGGGFEHPVGPDSVQTTMGPALLVLDSRSGDLLARHDDAAALDDPRALGEVRWVKVSARGVILAGLRRSVGAFDLAAGEDLWRAEGAATGGTLDAWVDGDLLWMLGPDRGLRQLRLETGELSAGAMSVQGRTHSRRQVRLTRIGSGIVLSSGLGVVILDREGGLLGADAVVRQDSLLPPAVGEGLIVLVDTASRRSSPSGTHRLTLVNTTSARELSALDLVLGEAPTGVVLLDGHVLVQTPGGVTVLPAPAP